VGVKHFDQFKITIPQKNHQLKQFHTINPQTSKTAQKKVVKPFFASQDIILQIQSGQLMLKVPKAHTHTPRKKIS
jgi:hypothetical protein